MPDAMWCKGCTVLFQKNANKQLGYRSTMFLSGRLVAPLGDLSICVHSPHIGYVHLSVQFSQLEPNSQKINSEG